MSRALLAPVSRSSRLRSHSSPADSSQPLDVDRCIVRNAFPHRPIAHVPFNRVSLFRDAECEHLITRSTSFPVGSNSPTRRGVNLPISEGKSGPLGFVPHRTGDLDRSIRLRLRATVHTGERPSSSLPSSSAFDPATRRRQRSRLPPTVKRKGKFPHARGRPPVWIRLTTESRQTFGHLGETRRNPPGFAHRRPPAPMQTRAGQPSRRAGKPLTDRPSQKPDRLVRQILSGDATIVDPGNLPKPNDLHELPISLNFSPAAGAKPVAWARLDPLGGRLFCGPITLSSLSNRPFSSRVAEPACRPATRWLADCPLARRLMGATWARPGDGSRATCLRTTVRPQKTPCISSLRASAQNDCRTAKPLLR